jgi:hypothetical protein
MAKKNSNKAKHQPKNAKKVNSKATLQPDPIETNEVIDEATEMEQKLPVVETTTDESDNPLFDPNSDEPIVVSFELGEDPIEEETNTEIDTKDRTHEEIVAKTQIEAPITEVETAKPIKNQKSRLSGESIKLVGCSYHYFRKYFKKQFEITKIKVRFVKQATGYNGHMEVTEANKEKAIELLETIKSDNSTVKNLYWDIAIG